MDYFSTHGISPLSKILKGSHIHIVGVCGVAMAQLAIELTTLGYEVSGSDVEFYEPMSSLLKNSKVSTIHGYDEKNITPSFALCVIGNSIRKDNPELLAIEKYKIPYTCFPAALFETVIKDKKSIVVSGTHGKTTTTALTAWALISSGMDPSYFIGGAVTGLSKGLHIGKGEISVVEGDEYDSSFFAKVPKFTFYKPDVLIITSVEFDHADIYSDIEAINKEFLNLSQSMKSDGYVLVSDKGENLRLLTKKIKDSSKAKVLVYGESDECDVKILKRETINNFQSIQLSYEQMQFVIQTQLFGEYNAYNCVASYMAQLLAGVSEIKGFESFSGVKRRQDIRFQNDSTVLIEDFAHHPTAVKETLKGIQERFPGKKIISVFEPRSNTSRRKIFQKDYEEALLHSDVIFIKEVVVRHNDTKDNLLSINAIKEFLIKSGKVAETFLDKDEFFNKLKNIDLNDSVIVLMSNGSFDGIPQACEDYLISQPTR